MRPLAVLCVCLAVPAFAWGDTPEQVLAGLEKSLAETSLHATVTGETEGPDQKGTFKGEVALQGESVLVRMESVTGLHVRIRAVGDGEKVVVQAWTGKPHRKSGEMKGARSFWAKTVARLGLGGAVAFSSGAFLKIPHPNPDEEFKVLGARLEQAEGGTVLRYKLDVGAPMPARVSVTFDGATKLPKSRRVELGMKPDTMIISETYTWERDPKFPEGTFRVAPEMPSAKDLAEQKRQADVHQANLKERQVQLSLRQLTLGQILYRDTHNVFAKSLKDLKVADALRSGEQHGYTFELCVGSQAPDYYWMAVANPKVPGTGDSFAITQKGELFRRTKPIPLEPKRCQLPDDVKRVD